MMKKIIILGGGTSGWLTAAYLIHNLNIPIQIQLIEDFSKGPIGVGEGTQPFTAKFLYECGLEPKTWMKPSNSSFKYGVEFIGWNNDPYFVDNDLLANNFLSPNMPISKYFMDKPHNTFSEWQPSYKLAKSNISPKLDPNTDINFGVGVDSYGAVHFSAYEIIDTIKNLILNKINYINTKIVKTNRDESGITEIIDINNQVYKADLYLDCSGFNSILLGQTLQTPFNSYNKWLLNDSAVTISKSYTNPQQECHPYTKATAMNSGWKWTIPTYLKIGNGYVYNSSFTSPDQAEQELRHSINEFLSPAKHLKMKIGSYNNIAVKNVVGIGLSAGFVEPLEATGITFTTSIVKNLCKLLNITNNNWTDHSKSILNKEFNEMCFEILAFVYAHYYFSSKNDTPYWQEIRNSNLNDLPTAALEILEYFYPKPKNFTFLTPKSMFTNMHWWSVLHAGGAYKDITNQITPSEIKYFEYFINTQNFRINESIKLFGNHYDFLDNWYKSE